MEEVARLRRLQRDFVRERDWEQFHTPKNVAMALGGEMGELAEAISRLKYRSMRDSFGSSDEVSEEVGDVTLYLLRLHDLLDVEVFEPDAPVDSTASPKPAMLINAVFRLMASVGRILECFQWVSGDETLDGESHQRAVGLIQTASRDLGSVCNLLGVNPVTTATAKLEKNRQKYPVLTSRGSSRKYTEIGGHQVVAECSNSAVLRKSSGQVKLGFHPQPGGEL